jgi:hypothetical protein
MTAPQFKMIFVAVGGFRDGAFVNQRRSLRPGRFGQCKAFGLELLDLGLN